MVVAHRLAPVAHHEIGIELGGLLKGFECLFKPERVKGGNASYEVRLYALGAGIGKDHIAELGLVVSGAASLCHIRDRTREQRYNDEQRCSFHHTPTRKC